VFELEAGKPTAELNQLLRVLAALDLRFDVSPMELADVQRQEADSIDLDDHCRPEPGATTDNRFGALIVETRIGTLSRFGGGRLRTGVRVRLRREPGLASSNIIDRDDAAAIKHAALSELNPRLLLR
jgi:hypothetical protein